jgi:hypothetical protein
MGMSRYVLLVGLVVSLGCRSREPEQPIRPGFEATAERGRPVALHYSWELGADLKPQSPDLQAFVHFLVGKRIVFTDDHVPVPPPAEWKPGSTYRYVRTRFIVAPEGAGDLEVRMGLYDPKANRRLSLTGKHAGMQEYSVGRVVLGSAPVEIPLVHREGWYQEDRSADGSERAWTARLARTTFANPRRDVIVYVEADTNAAAFKVAPTLTVRVGAYGSSAPVNMTTLGVQGFRFPAEALGSGDSAELRLSTTETFVPRALGINVDDRELGLLVHRLAVVPAAEPVPDSLPIAVAQRLAMD